MVSKKKVTKNSRAKVYAFVALFILLIILAVALIITVNQSDEVALETDDSEGSSESLSASGYVTLTIEDPKNVNNRNR